MEKRNVEYVEGIYMNEECIICGEEMKDVYDTHNAQPVADGRCCTDCNFNRVIPARIQRLMKR